MKVRPEQLAQHLQRHLAPLYLIGGDEPLQAQEAADAVRVRARELGHSEREVMHVERGFDWNTLAAESCALSLFGDKRLLELRLPSAKPGDAGSRALVEYCQNPAPDTVLMILTGKWESASTRSKWFKAIDSAGVIIQVWPLEPAALPRWIEARMKQRGLTPTRDAVTLLADKVEGNLLACAQEIEKLLLLHGPGRVDAEVLSESVADSARYNVFGLADSALAGRSDRVARMLDGLQGEGIEPVLVLWALAREVRQLAQMSQAVSAGEAMEAVLNRYRVWERRKALYRTALKRHDAARWVSLLRRCAQVDRVIKGQAAGHPWSELVQLAMSLASAPASKSHPLFAPAH